MKITDYKNVQISLDEKNGRFYCNVDDEQYFDDTLEGLKKKIDTLLKKEFKRISVFKRIGGWREDSDMWGKAEITSVNVETGSAFVVDANKNREKVNLRFDLGPVKDTKDNAAIITEINAHLIEIKRLRNVVKENEKKLVRITAEELGYNGGRINL